MSDSDRDLDKDIKNDSEIGAGIRGLGIGIRDSDAGVSAQSAN